MKDGKGTGDDDQGKEEHGADEEERAEPSAEERHQDGSYVGAAAPAGGSGDGQEDLPAAPIDSLTPEEQEAMRSQLDTLLVQAQEGGAVQIDAEREAYGQQVMPLRQPEKPLLSLLQSCLSLEVGPGT